MEFSKLIHNSKGQSAVEYLLLLAVVVSMVTGILQSEFVVNLIGADGALATNYKLRMENSYRFATKVTKEAQVNYNSLNHPSYADETGSTHFFSSVEPYER